MKLNSKTFRQTMGLFATGVAVAVTQAGPEMHAMTANSVTSVSLDPLLVLFCPNKQSQISLALERTTSFSLNILREDQAALSAFFADLWTEPVPPPFEFVPWVGAPRLAGCLASIACEPYQIYDGGDHWIVVGRVVALYQGAEPRRPLVFFGGQYRHLAAPAAEPTAVKGAA
jgi:flavin reductase (DIM6/NTAB) family NADH-FMN oxidoreductase RutF